MCMFAAVRRVKGGMGTGAEEVERRNERGLRERERPVSAVRAGRRRCARAFALAAYQPVERDVQRPGQSRCRVCRDLRALTALDSPHVAGREARGVVEVACT